MIEKAHAVHMTQNQMDLKIFNKKKITRVTCLST